MKSDFRQTQELETLQLLTAVSLDARARTRDSARERILSPPRIPSPTRNPRTMASKRRCRTRRRPSGTLWRIHDNAPSMPRPLVEASVESDVPAIERSFPPSMLLPMRTRDEDAVPRSRPCGPPSPQKASLRGSGH